MASPERSEGGPVGFFDGGNRRDDRLHKACRGEPIIAGIQGGRPPWSQREVLAPREKGRQRAAALSRRALEGGNAKRVPPPRRLVPPGGRGRFRHR